MLILGEIPPLLGNITGYLGIPSNAFSRSIKTMCTSVFFSLHFSCSYHNAKTVSVVEIPGLKPTWLALIFTMSLSRASMIRSHSFMK